MIDINNINISVNFDLAQKDSIYIENAIIQLFTDEEWFGNKLENEGNYIGTKLSSIDKRAEESILKQIIKEGLANYNLIFIQDVQKKDDILNIDLIYDEKKFNLKLDI